MSYDCVVIGGGVLGGSVAYHLARRDVKVLLLERGRVGQEASWAAAGVLTEVFLHHDWDEEFARFCAQAQAGYRDFVKGLPARKDGAAGAEPTGSGAGRDRGTSGGQR